MKERFSEDWVLKNQDPYLLHRAEVFAKVLSWISGISGAAFLLLHRQNLPLSLISMFIPVLCLVLDGIFPAYFTLLYGPKDAESEDYSQRASLILPFLFGLFSTVLATISNFAFFQLRHLILYGILFAILCGTLMCVFIPELEESASGAAAMALMLALFGWGYIGQVNYYLDTAEPEVQVGVITRIDRNRSTKGSLLRDLSGDIYTVTVQLPDGTEVTFGVPNPNHVLVGAAVPVHIHRGGLGIRFYIIDRDGIYRRKGVLDYQVPLPCLHLEQIQQI